MSAATKNSRGVLAARLFPAGLAAALVGVGLYFDHSDSFAVAPRQHAAAVESELAREAASPDVRDVVQWSVSRHDHAGLPFVVIDKSQARIYAFDPQGRLRGTAPVLVDGSGTNGIPAGRFTAEPLAGPGPSAVVWANGGTRVAVWSGEAPEPGGASAALQVAPEFWHECVAALRTQPSIAYVLPQTLPAAFVIGDARGSGPAKAQGDSHETTYARQGR